VPRAIDSRRIGPSIVTGPPLVNVQLLLPAPERNSIRPTVTPSAGTVTTRSSVLLVKYAIAPAPPATTPFVQLPGSAHAPSASTAHMPSAPCAATVHNSASPASATLAFFMMCSSP